MTDTTHEAPERIWAWETLNCNGQWTIAEGDGVEYVRADLVQAAVAAALREAAGIASYHQDWGDAQSSILALITPDAQAALDRYVKERQSEKDMLRKHLKYRFDVLHGGRE